MGNIIVSIVIISIICGAVGKIIIDKKNGVMCAGCPHSPKGIKKCEAPSCHTDVIQFDK